jgi:thiamine transport system permease protein
VITSKLIRFVLVLFLLFPFIFLVINFQLALNIDVEELVWAFKNSFIQAFFSALGAMLFGYLVALGLLSFSAQRGLFRFLGSAIEVLCLAPNFLPPIFVLLVTMNVIDPFPMGVIGVVFLHVLVNFGLVGVLFADIIRQKLGGMIELAYIEGASRWQFTSKVLMPVLKKDFTLVGLFVFVICFSSFSIPLIVGGSRGTTIEVLIYEKMRLAADWGGAVFLAMTQSLFIFALSFVANRRRADSRLLPARMDLLSAPSLNILVLMTSTIFIYGYAIGFFNGLKMATTLYDAQSAIIWNFFGSLVIGLFVGAITYISLMLIAYAWAQSWFEKFMRGYVAPSTSLACFCFLIIGPNNGWYPFVKIPLALLLLSLNGLYRIGWESELQSLQKQVNLAYSMGARQSLIFREILFPQLSERAGVLSGLASVWACGDFAVSRILGQRDITIGMMTETLMSSYRLHQATLLSGLIIFASLICFIICLGGSRVLRRKLAS